MRNIENFVECDGIVFRNQGASASTSPISRVEENCFLDTAVSALNIIMGLKFTKQDVTIEILLNQLILSTPYACYFKKTRQCLQEHSGLF